MVQVEKTFLFGRFSKAIRIFWRYFTVVKLLGLLRVEWERISHREIVSGWPYFIKLQPTNICHAGCSYCLRHEKNRDLPLGQMTLNDCTVIIDKIKKYAFLVGFQYNGEPLCNDYIIDMIQYAHSCRVGTYLSTNLHDLEYDDRQRLVQCGLDLLTVSIDGISAETYNKHRKKGDISLVLSNLRGVVDTKRKLGVGPFITLQFIVTRHNQHEIPEARRVVQEMGVDELSLKPVGTTDKSLLPDDKDLCRQGVSLGKKRERKMCWWLWGSLVVLWDGSVVPCCHISSRAAGFNVLSDNISSIMNNPVNRSLRRLVASKEISKDHPCGDCQIPYGSLLRQTL